MLCHRCSGVSLVLDPVSRAGAAVVPPRVVWCARCGAPLTSQELDPSRSATATRLDRFGLDQPEGLLSSPLTDERDG